MRCVFGGALWRSSVVLRYLALLSMLPALFTASVRAQSLNFTLTLTDGAQTPFNVSVTSPALLAQFTVVAGTGAASAFIVQPSFLSFSGEVLANSYSPGAALQIRFQPPLTQFSFLYGSFSNGSIAATLSRSAAFLANLSFSPAYVAADTDYEGAAAIMGYTFDSVVLTGVRVMNFAAGQLTGVEAARAVGDPVFLGLRAQSFQVHGIAGAVYALIADASLQLNARFLFLAAGEGACSEELRRRSPCWSHPGSYFGAIGIRTAQRQAVEIDAGGGEEGFRLVRLYTSLPSTSSTVLVPGERVPLLPTVPGSDGFVELSTPYELTVQTGWWRVRLVNSNGFVNVAQVVSLHPDDATLHGAHGLLGQTGRPSSTASHPYEGGVDDYAIESDDLLGTAFTFARFVSEHP